MEELKEETRKGNIKASVIERRKEVEEVENIRKDRKEIEGI